MDLIFIQVDVHFQGIFAKYPIRYAGGITQRLSDIDFAGMDKNRCYEFIERFTREKFEKLYYCQPYIDFPKGFTLISNEMDYVDFIAIAYVCGVILPMYVNHFDNSNMQEWLDEHIEEVFDNIGEEVIDGAGIIKEFQPGHLDVDEDDHGAEDVDAYDNKDKDDLSNPHFFKKDNGPDVDTGKNASLGEPLEEYMDDNEDVYPELPNIFNEKLQ
ncbi:unnamed protein product [Lactuca saligna]|uniref:Uncharacterized protein n=1 Tax=Lactuca saligna TaxID=75948 RepID=A0AA36A1G0_LACSI|nr:unnamed protein product [Lactuca saligna]